MITQDLWIEAHKFIFNISVGDSYGVEKIYCTKRTKNRIYFSNGSTITIKKIGNSFYLFGKNVNQILRDIEGYMVYLIQTKNDFIIACEK